MKPSTARNATLNATWSATRNATRPPARTPARTSARSGASPAALADGSPTQRRGAAAEEHACTFLRSQGLRIEARNVRYRVGEIDAIARDGRTWVFVEVRWRGRAGDAAASIDARKRGKIRRAAQLYLLGRFGNTWPPCRFDVVVLEGSRIQWLRSAFSGEEE